MIWRAGALFFTIFLAVIAASAEDIKIRTGRALAGEVGTAKVEIKGETEHTFEGGFERAYAILTMRLAPGRTLSVYDYSLKVGDRTFPAVALRGVDGEFLLYPNRIGDMGDKSCQILFIIDKGLLKIGEKLLTQLHAEFPPQKSAVTLIAFKNIADGEFKIPAMIYEKGEF